MKNLLWILFCDILILLLLHVKNKSVMIKYIKTKPYRKEKVNGKSNFLSVWKTNRDSY